METTVKHALTSVGVSDTDVLSSIHEIRRDDKGEWVVQRISLSMKNPDGVQKIVRELQDSGAQVDQSNENGKTTLTVKHGSRVYQEIEVLH